MLAVRSGLLTAIMLFGCLISAPALSWADSVKPRPQVTVTQDSSSLKRLQAEVLVNAPVDTVWQELSNYGNLKNFFPGYERTTVLQSSGTVKTLDLQVKASSFLPTFHYQVRIQEDKLAYTLHIQRISGDFRQISANYQLIPVDGGTGTRVLYSLSIDVGNNLPPIGVSSILKASTTRAMSAIQRHCDEVYRRSLTAQAGR